MSEIILLAKSLLSEYTASWTKEALSNSFLYKCFKWPISLNFWILSRCLVNRLMISNIIKIVEYYLIEFLIFNESQFFLATNSTIWLKQSILFSFFDTWIFVRSIFLTTDTIGFHCFYIIYSTEVSGFFISSFISLYSLNTLFPETFIIINIWVD